MKAVVTGSAGFIGSSITEALLRDGYDVVGVDSFSDYYDTDLKKANVFKNQCLQYKFVEADLNSADLAEICEGTSLVFHQAGQPGVRKSWGQDFAAYTAANVNATQRLLESLRDSKTLERFVYASSSSIYGDADVYPTTESDVPRPISPYGVTKLAAEHLCSLYGKNFGMPTTSLRYFTVYGPGQRPDMAFTRFLKASVYNSPITIYGTGDQIRDFTYVGDVVQANLAAARSAAPGGSVYNVAGGSNVSVTDVLTEIQSFVDCPLQINHVGPVAGDVRRTGGSTRLISESLGWAPSVSLSEGLRRQYEWVRETTS